MVKPNKQTSIIDLPLYEYLKKSTYWYGLIPELICIQGIWIEECAPQVTVSDELRPYLLNAVSLHRTAITIAGNDRAYFSLYSLRAILERVALSWTAHPNSTVSNSDVLRSLKSNNQSARKRATQDFIAEAESFDSDFALLYSMVSQYFAHASKMDSLAIDGVTEKDELLKMRMKVLPLLLLLDTGHRIVLLIQELLKQQGTSFRVLDAGRKPAISYDIDKYVRLCSYITCEKHTPKSGVPISTLMKNVANVTG